MKQVFHYSEEEEKANALTHFIGALFALYVIFDLSYSAAELGWVAIVANCVFGFTLLLMYTSSTFYHLEKKETRKRFLKRMDHVSIYLLIAGTTTPLLLVNLKTMAGYRYCIFLWLFAFAGSLYKLMTKKERERISLFFYLAMGWSATLFWKEIKATVPQMTMDYILFGGLFFTIGTIAYSLKRVTYHHAIWHLFVMAGTFCHYYAIKIAIPS